MKTVLHTGQKMSFREERLLGINLNRPNSLPQPEQPQDEPRRYDIPADQVPPETLQLLAEYTERLRNEANETADEHLTRIVETAQRQLDVILSTSGLSRQLITDYLRNHNEHLHPRGLHMSTINGRVQITPHNPASPEMLARKKRIEELRKEIGFVNGNIQDLMHGFRQNAVQYRNFKAGAMNRNNFAREVPGFLMQFPGMAMQAHATPLHQLYARKFQLQQELAGVTSRMIKVPVPTEGEPDAGVLNPPRFAASARPDTRFNAVGAPGGVPGVIGPDGLPQAPEVISPATQARIDRLSERWRGSKTEEEREAVEGFLMMEGVDTDASDLKKDQLTMSPREERTVLFFVGLIKVLKSLLDRMGKKKSAVEEISDAALKDPKDMTPAERAKEEIENGTKLQERKEAEGKTVGEIKELKKKIDDPTTAPEVKAKLEVELKQKKEELKTMENDIRTLENRNKILAESSKKITDTKDTKAPHTLTNSIINDFANLKPQIKARLAAALPHIMSAGSIPEEIAAFGVLEGIDLKQIGTAEERKALRTKIVNVYGSMVDAMALTENNKGEYQISYNFGALHADLIKSGMVDTETTFTEKDAKEIAPKMSRLMGLPVTSTGTVVSTEFVSAEKIRKIFALS